MPAPSRCLRRGVTRMLHVGATVLPLEEAAASQCECPVPAEAVGRQVALRGYRKKGAPPEISAYRVSGGEGGRVRWWGNPPARHRAGCPKYSVTSVIPIFCSPSVLLENIAETNVNFTQPLLLPTRMSFNAYVGYIGYCCVISHFPLRIRFMAPLLTPLLFSSPLFARLFLAICRLQCRFTPATSQLSLRFFGHASMPLACQYCFHCLQYDHAYCLRLRRGEESLWRVMR